MRDRIGVDAIRVLMPMSSVPASFLSVIDKHKANLHTRLLRFAPVISSILYAKYSDTNSHDWPIQIISIWQNRVRNYGRTINHVYRIKHAFYVRSCSSGLSMRYSQMTSLARHQNTRTWKVFQFRFFVDAREFVTLTSIFLTVILRYNVLQEIPRSLLPATRSPLFSLTRRSIVSPRLVSRRKSSRNPS